jgi:hypothetical protein
MAIGSRRILGDAGGLFFGLVVVALAGPRVDVSGDPKNQVIVGEALSPAQTMPTVAYVLRFLAIH